LIAQYKLTAKPTSTGSISATLTQTMTGQVVVGFSGVPFFLDQMDEGQIPHHPTGNEVDALKRRTSPIFRRFRTAVVLVRFHAAY
jgi:hypothetical protein